MDEILLKIIESQQCAIGVLAGILEANDIVPHGFCADQFSKFKSAHGVNELIEGLSISVSPKSPSTAYLTVIDGGKH